VLQTWEHNPTPSSIIFTFELAFESFKEFGGALIFPLITTFEECEISLHALYHFIIFWQKFKNSFLEGCIYESKATNQRKTPFCMNILPSLKQVQCNLLNT